MNKFLSILAAVGKDALTVMGLLQSPLVRGAEALAPAAAQPVLGKLNTVVSEIATVQALGAKVEAALAGVTPQPGQSTLDIDLLKAQTVMPTVKEVMMQAEFLTGRKIADEALFTQGCQHVIDGLVDVLNSIEHPASTSSPASTPSSVKN